MVFRRFFVRLPPSFAKTGPQSDIQDSGGSEEQQRKIICERYSIQFLLNIHPNYNYLHKIKQGLTMESVRRRSDSIGNWKRSWDRIGVLRGAGTLNSICSKVAARVGDCLDQGGIFRR